MRGIDLLAMLVTAGLLLAVPASAAMNEAGASDNDAKDKMICKRAQRTGTRFQTKICRTAVQWEAISEQNKRDAKEMVDRPQVEIRRD